MHRQPRSLRQFFAVGVERYHRVVVGLWRQIEQVFVADVIGAVDIAQRQAQRMLGVRVEDISIYAIAGDVRNGTPHQAYRLRIGGLCERERHRDCIRRG